jgi:hypothetical protein
MAAKRSGITCGLLAAALLYTAPVHAQSWGLRRGGDESTFQGQEVVVGSYHCGGSVYSDDQEPEVSTYAYLSATSGITDGFYGTGNASHNVPADLQVMVGICQEHVDTVYAHMPRVCTLGDIRQEQGAFGNGESVSVNFDFSCQGTRDEVVGVIGQLSRLSLMAHLP